MWQEHYIHLESALRRRARRRKLLHVDMCPEGIYHRRRQQESVDRRRPMILSAHPRPSEKRGRM